MDSLTRVLGELVSALGAWETHPASLHLRLAQVSHQLSLALEGVTPEEVPGLLERLLGDQEQEERSLLQVCLGLAKDRQKERSKAGGDFLRDVAELLSTLLLQHPGLLGPRLEQLVHLGRALFFCHPIAKVHKTGAARGLMMAEGTGFRNRRLVSLDRLG